MLNALRPLSALFQLRHKLFVVYDEAFMRAFANHRAMHISSTHRKYQPAAIHLHKRTFAGHFPAHGCGRHVLHINPRTYRALAVFSISAIKAGVANTGKRPLPCAAAVSFSCTVIVF